MINPKLLQKITEKWPVKVLSVAAALIISIFYRVNTLETRFFSVPLQIVTSESLVPVSAITNTVRISLRGEPDGIQPIMEEDVEAYIDISKFSNEGSFRVPVQLRKKGSALGVTPLEISVLPIEISVDVELKMIKSIHVFPVLTGVIAQGFELADRQIIPDTIIAEGPRSALEDIREFYTENIDIDRRYENFSVRVNVINNNPLVVIHGDRMIEFRGTINQIVRGGQGTARPQETQSNISRNAEPSNPAGAAHPAGAAQNTAGRTGSAESANNNHSEAEQ